MTLCEIRNIGGWTNVMILRSLWYIKLEVSSGGRTIEHRRDVAARDADLEDTCIEMVVKMTRADSMTQAECLWIEEKYAEDLIQVFKKWKEEKAINNNGKKWLVANGEY